MRTRGWLLAALAAVAIVAAVPVVRWYRARGALGPLEATPAGVQLSVRVGESVQFSVGAAGAVGYTWTLWGRPVSFAPRFAYVPVPEDAGWQQVTVEVTGRGGQRAARTWDVGVIPPTPPVLDELTPPAGEVALGRGERGAFRCRARVPAARPADRLAFEWVLDDQPLLREEQPAAGGVSALELPPAETGTHRLRVRVTEDGRCASIAEWTIAIAQPETPHPAAPAEPAPEPPRVAAIPPPEPAPARPQLVHAPGPRRLEGSPGQRLVFETRVEPESTSVSYRWTLDRRAVHAPEPGRFAYEPGTAGRHTVAVTVSADGRTIGRDAWVVTVRASAIARTPPPPAAEPAAPRAAAPPPVVAAAPPPEPPAPSPALAESEVRAWLAEYALAWSRKDVAALHRMGQIRSAAEAAELERYFRSVDELHVDVRVLALSLDGERASVEFERTDTVIDPGGRRQELRLPPMRKRIERTPEGLRFSPG